jgi:hypothetical protein
MRWRVEGMGVDSSDERQPDDTAVLCGVVTVQDERQCVAQLGQRGFDCCVRFSACTIAEHGHQTQRSCHAVPRLPWPQLHVRALWSEGIVVWFPLLRQGSGGD